MQLRKAQSNFRIFAEFAVNRKSKRLAEIVLDSAINIVQAKMSHAVGRRITFQAGLYGYKVFRQQTYSVCFFDEAYREELSYLGRVSGKDEDKIRNSGLTVAFVDGTPYFEQAQTVLICKKLYSQKLEKAAFLAPEIPQKAYAGDDYHTMYISEILSLYQAE